MTKQEYEEQKKLGTQRFLEDLLDSIVHDKKLNEKERKKKLKQVRDTCSTIAFRYVSHLTLVNYLDCPA